MRELHFLQYIDTLEEYNKKYKETLKKSEQQDGDGHNGEDGK